MNKSWVGIIAFLGGTSFALLANAIIYVMIVRVNSKLPADMRLSYFSYGVGQVKKEYQRLYPGSKLYLLPKLCGAITFVCLLILISALGFFR